MITRSALRRSARWASAAISIEPPTPAITAYGAIRWADNCSAAIPASRGTASRYASATSSGPAAPEAAAPTRTSGARAARRAASTPITSAESTDSSAPGQ
ncbi:hypothetical protein KBX35_07870 [Micromonospora sp. C32]|nr:hypothetical protein [Micromonospora sp. C32]